MKRLILLFSICFCLTITQNAHSQNCSEGISLINELWQNFEITDLVNNSDGLKQQTDKLKNELTSFAKLSLKKDAPRLLAVNASVKKINLKQHRKRIFVTTPLKQDAVLFTITRPETSSKARVTICAHTMKGNSVNLEKVMITGKNDGTIQIPVSGISGKILSVSIVNLSEKKINYLIAAK